MASLLRYDAFKQKQLAKETATRVGLLFTILAPLAIAAYAGVLLAQFLTRPVVLTTTTQSTFFTTPAPFVNCTCAAADMACRVTHTFVRDNDLSSYCAAQVEAGPANLTGRVRIRTCYAVRSSERVVVEVPRGCRLIGELESRQNVPFDFDQPLRALQKVFFDFPYAERTRGDWVYRRLIEVHRENIEFPPYKPPTNLTVWWGEELRVDSDTALCSDGTTQCARFSIGAEAVVPVFIYERLGSVATLIAEIGGAVSLVISVFYSIVFVYRIVMYWCFDPPRLDFIKQLNQPDNPQPILIGSSSSPPSHALPLGVVDL